MEKYTKVKNQNVVQEHGLQAHKVPLQVQYDRPCFVFLPLALVYINLLRRLKNEP